MTIINRIRPVDRSPPIKCCPACFFVMPSGVKECQACGHEFPRRVDPLKAWEHHDASLRSIDISGRMFVAWRRDRSSPWSIKDASTLAVVATGLRTRAVTAFFRQWDDKAEAEAFKALLAEFA